MPSSYSTDLKLELMVTGENSNTWGDKTNNNLNLIQQAVAGYEAISITSTTTTLVMTNANISDARNMVLEFTGTLSGNSNIEIPDGIEKFYLIKDSTTHSGYTLTFKTVSGTGFDLTSGFYYFAYSNGTNVSEVSLDNIGGSIGTAQIENDAITTAKISSNQITTALIANDAITTAKISSNQITTALIDNNAVTAAKLERKFTISTSNPAGGSDGDLWFKYTP